MTSDATASDLPLVVFDDQKGAFGPLTDLRAAFALRSGVGTLLESIEAALGARAAALLVPDRLAALVGEQSGLPVNAAPACDCLAVNGRLLDPRCLIGLPFKKGASFVDAAGTLVAAVLPGGTLGAAPPQAAANATTIAARLANAPWDLTAAVGDTLAADLAAFGATRLSGSATRHLRPDEGQSFGAERIVIHPTATLGPLCVIDASKGPVVIGAGVTVRPFAVLVGPCAVLDGSTVAERALIKSGTVVGPQCRVGGEIGSTIFQGHSNKSHDGHLGDSFVGEWVNIGAGTDNSNLLNTYGEVIVRLEPDGGLVKTGRQFWGSILGDHVKLAIGTRLMTGTTVGTGAMVAQSTPPASLVARFAWCVDGGDGPRAFRFEKFMDTARAMMSRRGCAPGPALEAALRALHAKATGA